MIPPGPASHTHDDMDRRRDREIRLVQARDEALRERDQLGATFEWQRTARLGLAAKLAAIDGLHRPDPDNNHACQCGLTRPCPTRRALDGGTP